MISLQFAVNRYAVPRAMARTGESTGMSATHDLIILGGGINGAGIARDAAGRGLKVALVDAGDLGGATSAASSKLIHGGLRYLEFYAFELVAKALAERERLLAIAPHIIQPLGFVIPVRDAASGGKPAWMLRLGLWLYDHLARRRVIPGSAGIRLRDDPAGQILDPAIARGFRYWDCSVADNRLTILNALDAQALGADIRPRTAARQAEPEGGSWRVHLEDGTSLAGRMIINATGPWADRVDRDVLGLASPVALRLVKGSHIVVPRIGNGGDAYLLTQPDGRIVFLIPFERDFSMIGTTEARFHGDPRDAAISAAETDYLLDAVNRYLARPIDRAAICWSFAGVRPLVEDRTGSDRETTRDWRIVEQTREDARALTILGGKITTYRVLAESVVDRLAPALGCNARAWTADRPLPGGDFDPGYKRHGKAAPDIWQRARADLHPWLPDSLRQRWWRTYGTRIDRIIGDATRVDDLGAELGPELHVREVDYLVREEWARTADDILWRRTKLGLRFDAAARARLEAYLDANFTSP